MKFRLNRRRTACGETLLVLWRPLAAISWLFTPFVYLLSWIGAGFTRLVGGNLVPRSIVSDEEIRTMISVGAHEGTVEEEEAHLLSMSSISETGPYTKSWCLAWRSSGSAGLDHRGLHETVY